MRAAIVLAAGASRRFGRSDKLKALIRGRSLLEHAVANARTSGACRVVAVVAGPARIRNVTCIRVRNPSDGLAVSLTAGLRALMPIEREVHIFLADMPFARATRMRIPPGYDAIRPIWRGMPGHPMLVRVSAAKAALGGGGEGLAGRIRTAFTEGSYGSIADIDTRAGLRRARLCGSRTPPRRSRSG